MNIVYILTNDDNNIILATNEKNKVVDICHSETAKNNEIHLQVWQNNKMIRENWISPENIESRLKMLVARLPSIVSDYCNLHQDVIENCSCYDY